MEDSVLHARLKEKGVLLGVPSWVIPLSQLSHLALQAAQGVHDDSERAFKSSPRAFVGAVLLDLRDSRWIPNGCVPPNKAVILGGTESHKNTILIKNLFSQISTRNSGFDQGRMK